jgi:hypothetical protein
MRRLCLCYIAASEAERATSLRSGRHCLELERNIYVLIRERDNLIQPPLPNAKNRLALALLRRLPGVALWTPQQSGPWGL